MVHHFGVSCLCREELIQAQCSRLFQANDVLWNVVWWVANGILGANQHWCEGFVYEAVIFPMVDIFDSKEATIQRIDSFVCPSDGLAPGNAILELDSDCWDENGKTPEMARHYGIGSSRWYWCSYGPEDNSKKLSNKKRDISDKKKKKRGCTCHFIVKVLYGRPDVAILILKQSLHANKNGEACHGVDDTSNELCSQFAPNLSDECKAYIERLLLMDVNVDAIVDKHLDDLVFHDMLKKRDSFVTCKDVINAATRVRSIWSQKHVHNATSILE
ncbi:hypothetical protein SUGI_0430090 [Cryptomeria japonica]|nr:hypothetical protein SUGI_0430090 [Cryptomeria japonica]